MHGVDRSQAMLTVQQPQKIVTEEFYESHAGYSPSATAPEFVRPFSAEYQLICGQKARLECVMVGNPRPKITWVSFSCTRSNNGKHVTISVVERSTIATK